MADSQAKIRELEKKVTRLEREACKARKAESRLKKKEEEFQVFRKMLIDLSRNIIFLRSLIDMPELYLDGQWRIVGCSGNFVRLSPKAAEFARKKKHLREFLREGDFKKIEKYLDRVEALRTLPFEEGNAWRLRYKGPNGRDRIGKTWTGFANSAGGHNWSIVSENGKRRFRHAPHIEDNMDCYLVSAREYGGPDEDLKISCKFRTSANPGFIRDLSVVLSAASGLEETLPDLVGYTVCTGARDNTEASIQRQQHGLITIVESLEPDTEYRVTVERTGGRIRRSVENLSSGVPLAELEIVDPNAIYDRLNHVGFTTFSGELEVEDIEIYTRKTRFPIEQFKIPFEVETEIRYPKLEGRFYRLRLGMGQSNGRVLNTLLFEDVTEARIAEEHLKRSEKYIRTLVEKAYELIVILEPHGRIHYISPSVENVLGFDSAEVAGRMIFDFIHREDLPRANKIFAALVAEAGGSVSASFRIIDKAGNWRNMEGTGRNLIAEPSIRGIVINAHDITENLKAERDLREREEWFRLVFDGSRDAIFITGEDSGFVEVNEAAVTLTGYSKPELLKMKIPDLHDEFDRQAYYKFFDRIMAGENIISESKIRRKDGSKVFTEFSNRRIIIRGVPYMHTIARDVADRKEADQALHESGERYRLLIENAGHPIYMIDFEGTILMLNNLAAGYLEMSPEQVTGRSIWELFHPRLASRHLKDVFQALSGAGGVDVEYQVRLQGKKMWFKVNIQPYGKVDGRAVAQVIAQDITELKQAQGQLRKERDSLEIRLSEGTAALRHSELRLQESLKELTCLFSIRQEFDQEQSIETTLTSCAAHIRKTLHQPENKIVGINLDGVQMTTEGWDYLTENYVESLLQIGGVKRGFLRVKALRPHVEFLPFEQDLIRHAGAALSDFIHNRELRAQLIQTEKMAAAGRLAAGVAHEINNPLGAIKNSLYIIKRSIPGNHPDYAYFELMNSEIDRVAGIIAQLYNLYKPSSQEVQAVDLQVIVGNVLKMLESQVRRRKIVVQNEIEGSGFSPRLSVNQITQVLYNLILNAVQAMPQGGRLTLGLTKAGGSHELWISDTGPGIPDEVLPHIFEPFFTTKTKGGNPSEGMGIGLSLSRSFMEALGGKITVNTKVGWGTTFSLIFPAKIARGETKPPDAS